MWVYEQATGLLSKDGKAVWIGYSGHNEGLNNPDLEAVHDVGPIPCGLWLIGAPRDGGHLGPYILPLTPDQDTNSLGRGSFYIHGDNYHGDKSASHGCLIFPKVVREAVHESLDNLLSVVSGVEGK